MPIPRHWTAKLLGTLLIAMIPACEKKDATAPVTQVEKGEAQSKPVIPKGFERMSPAGQAAWLADEELRPAREKKAAEDKSELVRPAPINYKPEDADRRIRLRLVPQKEMMRNGESFWYRLELQNVGRKPIHWHENSSFFKHGRLSNSPLGFKFIVRQPDGKVWVLTPPIDLPLLGEYRKGFSFPSGTTEDEKARLFKRMAGMANINELSITLQPGETLISRPWAARDPKQADAMFARGEDPDSAIPGLYRELPSFFKFDQKGTYRIKVAFDDRLSSKSEDSIKSAENNGISREQQLKTRKLIDADRLGPVESNEVRIEVTP